MNYNTNHQAATTIAPTTTKPKSPCWVCGSTSSGNHYGAITCEACKLFFRRHSTALQNINNNIINNNASASNTSSSPSSSASSSPSPATTTTTTLAATSMSTIAHCTLRNCRIDGNTRSACPECRYRKCIAVGMGLKRTMFGRHTNQQKSKYKSRGIDLSHQIRDHFAVLKNSLAAQSQPVQAHDSALVRLFPTTNRNGNF